MLRIPKSLILELRIVWQIADDMTLWTSFVKHELRHKMRLVCIHVNVKLLLDLHELLH